MNVRFVAALLFVVAALGPVAFPWLKTPMIIAICHGMAVLGVMLLIRAGQVSFGHAMYMCISGYAVAAAARLWQLDAVALLFLGTFTSVAVGAAVGLFMVHYRGIFFGMINLAFSMVLFSALGKFGGVTGGTDGSRFDRPDFLGMTLSRENFEWALLYSALFIAVLCGVFVHRFLDSAPGQALRALKTNETRLEYLGISAKRTFWYGYLISAVLCGIAGSIFALTQGLITPDSGYWVRSAEIVFIAILGGAGHTVGAFLGALVFEFAKLYAAALLTGAWQMALGFVLIVIIFAAPAGLVGLLQRKIGPARSVQEA